MNNKDSESSSYSYSKHPQSFGNRNFTPVNTTTIGRVLPLVSVLEDNSNQTLRDTELSIKSGFKSVKNLTHPSDLRKRYDNTSSIPPPPSSSPLLFPSLPPPSSFPPPPPPLSFFLPFGFSPSFPSPFPPSPLHSPLLLCL